jgi:RNA polymerase-binding transcription factor DksA
VIEEIQSIRESDETDLASRITEVETQEILKKRDLPPKVVPEGVELKESDFECLNCGDNVPKARRLAGYRICVECAKEKERLDSLYAR